MTKFSQGQKVVCKKRIFRAWTGNEVPEGSKGKVVRAPSRGRATVRFKTFTSWSGEDEIELEVEDKEIDQA